jgi:hypothetical protein
MEDLPRARLGPQPMVVSEDDRVWLGIAYPGLVVEATRVAGNITFEATYNAQAHRFLVLRDGVDDDVGGLRLSGTFRITIQGRLDAIRASLPALYVDGADPLPDRHFNQADSSACLCSPLEEQEFLSPAFEFRRFFEQLVVPFLYGQVFYSAEGRWPWFDYSHGAIGLLESYGRIADASKARECLAYLQVDPSSWPRIRQLLSHGSSIKGATRCLCNAGGQIRRCHPAAWHGIRQLKDDIIGQKVPVP